MSLRFVLNENQIVRLLPTFIVSRLPRRPTSSRTGYVENGPATTPTNVTHMEGTAEDLRYPSTKGGCIIPSSLPEDVTPAN